MSNVGSMNVVYSVAVDQAIKNLNQYNKVIVKNEKIQNEVSKKDHNSKKVQEKLDKKTGSLFRKTSDGIKKGLKGITIGTAAVVAGFYGLIKSSSYGTMYMSMFGATTQQLADTILEKTGMNKALDDGANAFQKFADKISDGDGVLGSLLDTLKDFKDWFKNQSTFIQFISVLGGIVAGVSLVIAIFGAFALAAGAVSGGIAAISTVAELATGGLVAFKAALLGSSVGSIALGASIGLITGAIIVWLMEKTGIDKFFIDLGKHFRDWDSWIHDILVIASTPFVVIGSAIRDLVHGNLGFPLLHQALELIGNSIINLTNCAIDQFNKVINVVNNLIDKLLKLTGLNINLHIPNIPGIDLGSSSTAVDDSGFGGGWTNKRTTRSISNNSSSKMMDTTPSIDITKLNLQELINWVQTNIIDVSASWGQTTVDNMTNAMTSDQLKYRIPNQVTGGMDHLVSVTPTLGLNTVNAFKSGINEELDNLTSKIPVGMITGFKQLESSSRSWGAKVARQFQLGLSSVHLTMTVHVQKLSSGGSGRSIGSTSSGNARSNISNSTSGDINITNNISVAGNTKNNDLAREISKQVSAEVKRIVKI